jgi:glutathione S-transferase
VSVSTSAFGAGSEFGEEPPQHRLEFMHLEWMGRQHRIFGDLLQRFPSPHISGLGGADHEVDYWLDPDHYFFNAAMYSARRRAVAVWLGRQTPDSGVSARFDARIHANFGMSGSMLTQPVFVGGRPRLADASMEESRPEADVNDLVSKRMPIVDQWPPTSRGRLALPTAVQVQGILEHYECQVDHSALVRRLLTVAVAVEDPSKTPRPRFKALQHFHLADELLAAQVMSHTRSCV